MRPTGSVTVLAGLGAAACAHSLRAGGYHEPDTDFARYVSFTWDEPDERPVGDPRLENNAFFERSLHSAIEWELETRGIRLNGTGPSLTVHHHASVRDRVQVVEADRRSGYTFPGAYGPGTEVMEYDEGTFLVDVADGHTKQVIWRGWAVADISGTMDDVEHMRAQVSEAALEDVRDLPGREAGGGHVPMRGRDERSGRAPGRGRCAQSGR